MSNREWFGLANTLLDLRDAMLRVDGMKNGPGQADADAAVPSEKPTTGDGQTPTVNVPRHVIHHIDGSAQNNDPANIRLVDPRERPTGDA